LPVNHQEVQSLSHLELLAKQVVEGFITGLHKSPFHGFSVEFAEHRLYNTGESTRHIDWKLYGRTDKLFVKRYEEETNLRCHIVIDNSSSMHYPPLKQKGEKGLNKITFSAYCAAAFFYMMKQQHDAVGLTVFSDKLDLQTPVKSSAIHHKLLFSKLEEILADDAENRKKTATAVALHQLSESIHKRSLVIIFSDMFDNMDNEESLFKSLQHLKHNKHEVILFHVTDKKHELDFQFENRPYRFVDVETGEEVKVHSSQVRDKYLEAIHSYKSKLIRKCAQYKIDFVEADIHEGYRQVLLPYLLKREKMH
jgi:uncharacterized protein (DUF58 family)